MFKIGPILLGQNSKFPALYWVNIQNSPLFIGSIIDIQNSPLFIRPDSKFTPFYWVNIQNFPLFIGPDSKFTPFYWVNIQNFPFARKLYWASERYILHIPSLLGHPVLANTRLLDTLEASDALVDSETQVLLQPRRGTRDKLNKTKTSSALFIRWSFCHKIQGIQDNFVLFADYHPITLVPESHHPFCFHRYGMKRNLRRKQISRDCPVLWHQAIP